MGSIGCFENQMLPGPGVLFRHRKESVMFLDLITKRRSVRRYLEKAVEPKKVEALVEAALRSPSSMGNNPWEFIVVTDPIVLEKLSRAKPHGATFLKRAPLGMVVCADPSKSTVWIEDASIAAIYIHLAALSLGLGSCWIQIRERMHHETMSAEAYIAELLQIPGDRKVEAMIAIGYPAEEPPPHPKASLLLEKVYYESYGATRKPQ